MPLVMVGQAGWGPSDEHHRFRPALLWAQLVAVSLMAFVLAARAVPDATKPDGDAVRFDRAGAIFGFSASALLIAPFLVGHLYERYLIPVVPMVIVALAYLVRPPAVPEGRGWQEAATAFACLAVLGFGVISILFAHDSLLWNRLRWQAVSALVDERRVDPAAIDAGLSVSGWYLFPTDGPLRQRYANSPSEKGQWWRNDGAEYIVAIMTPKRLERMTAAARRTLDDELEVIWKKSFTGWLPGSGGDLLVCQGRLCESVFTRK